MLHLINAILGGGEWDLTKSNDENPYTNKKFNSQLITQRRHQSFDFTTIVDRLWTVRE